MIVWVCEKAEDCNGGSCIIMGNNLGGDYPPKYCVIQGDEVKFKEFDTNKTFKQSENNQK